MPASDLEFTTDVQTTIVNNDEEAPEWGGFEEIQSSESIALGGSKALARGSKGRREVKKKAKKQQEKKSKDLQKPSKTAGTGKQLNENAFGVLDKSDDENNADGKS